MKNPLLLKLLSLLCVGLALAAFLSMIQGIISERQSYRQEAISSVSDSVAGAQTLLGPVLHMSCTESWAERGADRKITQEKREFIASSTPQTLNVQTQVTVEHRTRSIYSAQVLNTKAAFKATFMPSDLALPKNTVAGSRMQCDAPILTLALDDPRGIRHASIKFNGQDIKLKAGTSHPTYKRGMHAQLLDLPVAALVAKGEALNAEMQVEFVGTQQLGIVPLGETTTISMSSNWPHPSFTGRFAPSERKISAGLGFTAEWRLNAVATNASEQVSRGMPLCDRHADASKECAEIVQVAFVEPVNAYSLSDRASKYGLLFIVLTFVAVGLFEVMKKLRVHPVQYLLAGSAICSFFLLLVSLSEHIGFARAYAAGASATVLLLTFYASHMLGGKWRGLPFGAGMAALYALLYLLLQLEQTALVMGSVVLFVVLAVVMILTRRINWYEQFSSTSKSASQAASSVV